MSKFSILLIAVFSSCFGIVIKFNAVDCNDEKIEVVYKLKQQDDTTYQCSTFVVKKDTTIFIDCKTLNKYPDVVDKLCP